MKEYLWVGSSEMPLNDIKFAVETPAFVYDEGRIVKAINDVRKLIGKNCQLLFPLKSFAIVDGLYLMAPLVDGFSCSSLFESILARDVLRNAGAVHITTPGYRPDEIDDIVNICDYISFNSLSQLERFWQNVKDRADCGIRVNPQVSFLDDDRYDPCRKCSKLGVPLSCLSEMQQDELTKHYNISGIHFHTNCDSEDFGQLLTTVEHLDRHISRLMSTLSWVNIGGGYLLNPFADSSGLIESIDRLRNRYGVDVFFEPGKAIVGNAACLVASVIDVFKSDGREIAILDTTVNHMPEVFEYQLRPHIYEGASNGKYCYILAGCSCLAGDVFGEYHFDEPLELDSRIVFLNIGAYSLVKAHMFNGINLPNIYTFTEEGRVILKKKFGYEEFALRYGEN